MTQYTTEWRIDRRVILTVVKSSDLTIQDMCEINQALVDLVRVGEPPLVHAIIDCRGIEKFQMNIPSISRILTFLEEPRMGWILIVSDDKLINFVASLVTQLAGTRFRNFSSVENAWDFLSNVDETLTPVMGTISPSN